VPRTAVINPRRRRRRSSSRRRRRRNPATLYGSASNPRRRRRRSSRRRRNPGSTMPGQAIRSSYSSRGYRQRNPGLNFDSAIDIIPAATAGVIAARWAVKLAGELPDDKPGIAHAIAVYLAAVFGGDLIGSLLGSSTKANYAMIGALGFGGDLFTRKVFLSESDWAKENLYLGEADEDEDEDEDEDVDLSGFTDQSALGNPAGQQYVDEHGRKWMQSGTGQWMLLSGPESPAGGDDYAVQADPSTYAGFADQSALGRRRGGRSSFGYA
jgi:hypothetical protein